MTKPIHNIRLGFGAIFHPKQPDLASTLGGFYESYFDRHRHELRWALFTSPKRYQAIEDKHRAAVRHVLTKRPASPYYFNLHSAKSAGDGTNGAPEHDLLCFTEGTGPSPERPWNALTLVQPEDDDHNLLLAELLELARAVELHYAVGGYWIGGFLADRERAYRTSLKYPGVEYWDLSRPKDIRRVRTTNWLTLVCNKSLTKLGGIDKLRPQLADAIIVHEVRNGWLFQAGPEPTLAEVGRPDELGPYREVARALKPIRDRPDESSAGMEGKFSLHEEKLWLARFDKDPPNSTGLPVESESKILPCPLKRQRRRPHHVPTGTGESKLPPGYAPPKPESEKKFLARLAKVQAEIGPALVDDFLSMVKERRSDFELMAKLERDWRVHDNLGIAAHRLSVVLFMKQLRLWRAAAAKDPAFEERWQAARKKHPELVGK